MLVELLRQVRLPRSVHALATTMLELMPSSPKHAKKESTVEAHCTTCGKVTSQRAVWVGRIMKGRQCTTCGLVTKPDPALLGRCYLEEVMTRAAAKPDYFQKHPPENWRQQLLWAPIRLVTKSLEEGHYLGDIVLDEREWVDAPHENAPPPPDEDE